MTMYLASGKHLQKQEQKNKAGTIGRQLKEKWPLQDLIDEQFKRYNQSMTPSKLKDVALMLAPKFAPSLEMMAVGWLGDWRPSAILELLRSLVRSSCLSSLPDSAETDRVLSQLIHEIRIEEAIIDEELAEIQATSILHLPFRSAYQPITSYTATGDDCVQSQLKKIKQVITKAQQLRCKVLELVTNKVLNQDDARDFLVALSGTQDVVHQFAARQKLQKGPVSISVKALASV